jgi:trimeric autotransporter adhesin
MRRYLAAGGTCLVSGTRWTRTSWTRTSLLILLVGLMLVSVSTLQAQGPALTTISGPVYRADGTAASGMALISWPSFQTAAGDAVTAGNQSVTIGAGGAFTAQLVPNAGASPTGTLYVVVFQLDDGTVRTEYWSVPTTSPATIAAVRTTPGTGLGNSVVTQQYVDAAVANRALDSTVVHLAGSETITGTKQFAAPPSLPQPVGSSDAANKGYVDAAVSNVGSGSYVSKAGDTMTGPLALPGEPGRMRLAEDRITALEHNDIKRNVYDRIVTAAIAFGVSALIALHDHFLPK